ncbi:MAG: single-stranded DNA-binding protein [Cyanobacteria bacterium NC_groundwater_1444_Ag_S-0.65um_54_12]|nr:single-stranded DNA-binding protein [Cyanobacteria bacterium NC_groundwater_1444_Ag_S-0.65um_54_12]
MVNSVVLVGRAGRDPEIRFLEPSGNAKTTFNLAVDRPVRRTEGVETTDWFRIELWGKQAQIAADYVRKGSLVGIQGRLEISKWKDAQGQWHEMPVITANNLRLLGSRQDNRTTNSEEF